MKYPTKDEEYTFENFYNERKINSEVDKFINDSIYRMYGLSQAEIDYIEQKRSD